eukprot:sb/3476931/
MTLCSRLNHREQHYQGSVVQQLAKREPAGFTAITIDRQNTLGTDRNKFCWLVLSNKFSALTLSAYQGPVFTGSVGFWYKRIVYSTWMAGEGLNTEEDVVLALFRILPTCSFR